MFSFDTTDLKTPKLSMEHVKELANVVANDYFNAGMMPTASLTKIAQSEELTPEQIKLIATEANKAIHQAKFAAADEKYFAAEFPLADAAEVIKSVQADGGSQKVAAVFVEPKISVQGPDPFQMFGVEPETMDKTAEVRHGLKTAAIKNEFLSEKLRDAAYMAKVAALETERGFIKQARQHALEGSNSVERLQTIGAIAYAAKTAGLAGVGFPALAKLAYVMGKEGMLEPRHTKLAMDYLLSKEADQKAPVELISENLACQVVNGQHPLLITLKTLKDHHHQDARYRDNQGLVDDQLGAIRQRLRAL